jgi:hypothetical protein
MERDKFRREVALSWCFAPRSSLAQPCCVKLERDVALVVRERSTCCRVEQYLTASWKGVLRSSLTGYGYMSSRKNKGQQYMWLEISGSRHCERVCTSGQCWPIGVPCRWRHRLEACIRSMPCRGELRESSALTCSRSWQKSRQRHDAMRCMCSIFLVLSFHVAPR